MSKCCRKCKIPLNADNWKKSAQKRKDYICKPCLAIKHATDAMRWKEEAIKAYGGKCVCCEEPKSIFLTIDHVDGNGAEHRKSLGIPHPVGQTFYRWLKRQGYPKDNYQLLCFNCNFAKHVLGTCPHRNSN